MNNIQLYIGRYHGLQHSSYQSELKLKRNLLKPIYNRHKTFLHDVGLQLLGAKRVPEGMLVRY